MKGTKVLLVASYKRKWQWITNRPEASVAAYKVRESASFWGLTGSLASRGIDLHEYLGKSVMDSIEAHFIDGMYEVLLMCFESDVESTQDCYR
jgi:hypothetical protein